MRFFIALLILSLVSCRTQTSRPPDGSSRVTLENTAQIADESDKAENKQAIEDKKEKNTNKKNDSGESAIGSQFLPLDAAIPSTMESCKKYVELNWVSGVCKRKGFKDLCMSNDAQIKKTISKIRNFLHNYESCDVLADVLKQQTSITLKSQGLTRLDPLHEFRGTLENLDVSGNTISDIRALEGDEEKPSALVSLDISDNSVTAITSLRTMKNLRVANLSRNPIKSLYTIKFLTSLQKLYADKTTSNEIQFASEANENGQLINRQLTELSLESNELTDQTLAQFPLFSVLSLLNLNGNNLTTTTNLLPMASITQLKLGSNRLIEVTGLAKYSTLEVLDLSGNATIVGLDGILGLTSLTTLDISGVVVQDLSVLGDLVNINQLQANGSQVSRLGRLEKLSAMKRFAIEGCQIQEPSDLEVLKGWKELQSVSVRNCSLPDTFVQVASALQSRGVFVRK